MVEEIELSDSQIIIAIINGEIDNYAEIIERYENKLLRYAIFLSKDYDIASDIVQETFIKAYINLKSFNTSKQFSPWIYRILHNEAMNLIKRNKKIIDIDIDNDKSDLLHINFETDKIIDHKILKSGLCKCLSNLKIKYREAIILFYFDNLKYDQIGEILHIPTSTVGIRIRRGKIMLKKICQDSGVKYE